MELVTLHLHWFFGDVFLLVFWSLSLHCALLRNSFDHLGLDVILVLRLEVVGHEVRRFLQSCFNLWKVDCLLEADLVPDLGVEHRAVVIVLLCLSLFWSGYLGRLSLLRDPGLFAFRAPLLLLNSLGLLTGKILLLSELLVILN